jgi:two-component system chemotaxis response regulator CheB
MSAFAQKGAELTLQALEAGAMDFVPKPANSLSGGIPAIAQELVEKVKDAARIILPRVDGPGIPLAAGPAVDAGVSSPRPPEPPAPPLPVQPISGEGVDLVAIGTSTGGPVALKTVLSGLPRDFPVGVVVDQHMPPVFTKAFAERLDTVCAVRVKEAVDGDPILPGFVLIAPGNWHMKVTRFGTEPRVILNQEENVNGHRPSVDVLVKSVAREYGSRAVGVIMTGMGRDGADGMRELRTRGGRIIAQDKATSVIFGMNKEVVQNGDAHEVVPVGEIAGRLVACIRGGVAARRAG